MASRMGISVNDHHANVKLNFKSKSVFIKKLQETERRNLALHHRASHERLKRVVLDSAERVMNIVTVADVKTQPKNQIIDGARTWLNEALTNHEEIMVSFLSHFFISSGPFLKNDISNFFCLSPCTERHAG